MNFGKILCFEFNFSLLFLLIFKGKKPLSFLNFHLIFIYLLNFKPIFFSPYILF